MQPKPSLDVSPMCRAEEIVASLDGVSDIKDAECALLNHGDDVLDVVIGMRETVRNHWLFGAMPIPNGAWNGDAVAIGSGPSLDDAIPHLRRIQDSVVLVAAHSAVPRLLAAGITPHVVAPKERDPSCGLIPIDIPSTVIYGGLTCVPEAPGRCSRHWLVGNCDHFISWLGYGRNIAAPLTSGTLSAWVAATIANSVYLVGQDMTMGHYKGYDFQEENEDGSIECVDGEVRKSCQLYRRARDELSSLASVCVMVQCAPHGAKIDGQYAMDGKLPEPGNRTVWLPTSTAYGRSDLASVADVKEKIRSIPRIMSEADGRLRNANDFGGLSSVALFGDNWHLGAAVLQTVYLSMSILRRTQSIKDPDLVQYTKHAISNTLDALRGTWEDMAHDCA